MDFLKLNVEGSDLEALEGAAATLRQRPTLAIEFHCFALPERERTVQRILDMLAGLDYSYEIQAEIVNRIDPVAPGANLFDSIVRANNPHLYCIPASA